MRARLIGVAGDKSQGGRLIICNVWDARPAADRPGRRVREIPRPRLRLLVRESAILEVGLALFGEGGHAFLLVLGREGGMEQPALEADTLFQRRLIGAV